MKVLAIETSSSRGAVALLDDDLLLGERSFSEGSRHGRELLPCVDALLEGKRTCVELIAVSAGPGSYTGLRVGLAFAKTFAAESATPVVTVSSLDVIAQNVAEACWLCVAVDARLGQVYAAVYDRERRKVLGDVAAAPGDVAAALNPETVVIGDGLRRYREAFAGAAKVAADESLWWPRAVHAGRLGHRKFIESGAEDPHALVPRYLRRAQAEVRWEELRSASGRK